MIRDIGKAIFLYECQTLSDYFKDYDLDAEVFLEYNLFKSKLRNSEILRILGKIEKKVRKYTNTKKVVHFRLCIIKGGVPTHKDVDNRRLRMAYFMPVKLPYEMGAFFSDEKHTVELKENHLYQYDSSKEHTYTLEENASLATSIILNVEIINKTDNRKENFQKILEQEGFFQKEK